MLSKLTPTAWAAIAGLTAGIAIGAFVVWLLAPEPAPSIIAEPTPPEVAPPPPPPPGPLRLKKAAFEQLQNWRADRQDLALGAFLRSCAQLDKRPPEATMDGSAFAGKVADWRGVCVQARQVAPNDPVAARAFFMAQFTPFAVFERKAGGETSEGLFTGYYVPVLPGRRQRGDGFNVPLLARPDDLVTVELGRFRDDLSGQSLYGRVEGGKFVHYYTRGEIEDGRLAGRGLELVWLQDPVEAFFLHIQGSGLIRFPDGSLSLLGFDGKNGHPYTSVGRHLIRSGALKAHEASMQGIKAWVAANPQARRSVLHRNKSFVFFREKEALGAIGAQQAVLTAGRSLAVDRAYIPLGAPLWLEIHNDDPEQALRRLMVAQDTGGAIKGPVRGDFYWGEGDEAGQIAGRMKARGRYYILLPNGLAARIAE